MTTPDYPDWLTPVAVVDQAADLLGGQVTFFNGSTTGEYDSSAVSTMSTVITPVNGAVGDRFELGVAWFDGGVRVDTDTITFHSLASYLGNVSSLYWRFPVRGTAAVFGAVASGGNSFKVSAFSSTRLSAEQRITVQGKFAGQFLASVPTTSVPAGGTIGPFYIPPVARAISIREGQAAANMNHAINGVYVDNGLMAIHLFQDAINENPAVTINELLIPNTGMELSITNNDAAAHTANAFIWDVS